MYYPVRIRTPLKVHMSVGMHLKLATVVLSNESMGWSSRPFALYCFNILLWQNTHNIKLIILTIFKCTVKCTSWTSHSYFASRAVGKCPLGLVTAGKQALHKLKAVGRWGSVLFQVVMKTQFSLSLDLHNLEKTPLNSCGLIKKLWQLGFLHFIEFPICRMSSVVFSRVYSSSSLVM